MAPRRHTKRELSRCGAGSQARSTRSRAVAARGDRVSAPLREILASYAEAAATSHMADTCRELIAHGARQQTGLLLRALVASSDGLGASVAMLADATGPGDERARELRTSSASIDRETHVLASKLMAGDPVAPGDPDDLMLDAGQLALDARLTTLDAELGPRSPCRSIIRLERPAGRLAGRDVRTRERRARWAATRPVGGADAGEGG